MALFRSLMFVPGHRRRMIERALGLGEFGGSPLDVAILDLEDGVPQGEKAAGRKTLAELLATSPGREGPARYVRVNPDQETCEADLDVVVRPGLEGIVAPKVDDADDLGRFTRALDAREEAAGLSRGSVRVIASIESARGLLQAQAIAAASDRVVGLLFGAEDFALDLGLPAEREAEAAELLHARSVVVVAAVAERRLAFDGIWPDIDDGEGLRRDALRARRLGFAGKSLIHPAQVVPVNEIFSPSEAELEHARGVVGAFEAAVADGAGAVALGGKLIDPPIVERARRTLRVHEAIRLKQGTPPVERPAALEGKPEKR